ncbi:MAG: hypothetical protein AB1551_08655, partial [Actinomycetota bacterium]
MSTTADEEPKEDLTSAEEPAPAGTNTPPPDEKQPTPEPSADVRERQTQATQEEVPESKEGPEGAPKKERKRSFLREIPILVLIALAIAILVKTFLIQAFY